MTILIYAEHDNNTLKPATASVVNMASQVGSDIHLLVAGHNCDAVAQEASKLAGVRKVLVADNAVYAHQLAENIALLVKNLASNYSHIFASATTTAKNFLPRVAALLDVNMVSDVSAVIDANTFERPIYAGNATATVRIDEPIVIATVRATAFDAVASNNNADIEKIDDVQDLGKSSFVGEELAASGRPELSSASVVVSGGRALGSSENFNTYIEPLADKLGAAIGASRAAVDAGFAPNDWQVGQTGKIVAPQLYIAIGISGAIQHLAGMKDSKVIVAINTDAESPIAGVADYFLEGDLFSLVPELTQKL